MMIDNIKNRIISNNILKNALIVFSGQTAASLIGFINLALLYQSIGRFGNGIIVSVAAYTAVFDGIFNFQSYNAVIKFGSEALAVNNKTKYKKYLKQALVQDIITAIIAFIVGSIVLTSVAKNIMHWDNEVTGYARIYLITILFNITGSLNGMLRLNDEFKVGAIIGVRIAILRLVLLIIGKQLNMSLSFYIYIEILLSLTNCCMLFYSSFKSLKKHDCMDFLHTKIGFDKEFTKFNLYNNIVSTIDMPTGQIVNLIISKFLGFSEVGIYNFFTKIGSLLTRVVDPVNQSLLPELSKMVANNQNKNGWRIVKKIFITVNIFMGIGIVVNLITCKLWMGFFVPVTINNIIVFCVYLIYISITSSVSGIHLMFVSLNLVKYNLPLTLGCNSIYLIMLYFLITKLGLLGIITALIFQAVLIASLKIVIVKKKGLF
jgi:O-antigen/teichoic acid export membrane protein